MKLFPKRLVLLGLVLAGLGATRVPCAAAKPVHELVYAWPSGPDTPIGGVVLGTDGNFYGTTAQGGAGDYGTVYKMTPAGVVTKLVEFTYDGAKNRGAAPEGGLVQGIDGNFYGTTTGGGSSHCGTVFKMTPKGVLTTLVEFTGNGATNKGAFPGGKLLQDIDGTFYGTTPSGGVDDLGTIFKMTPGGTLTTLVEFTGDGAINRGAGCNAALTRGSDGWFYGTTFAGGADDSGTVFKMAPDGTLTTLVEFTSDMGSPNASVVQGLDGSYYGTASGNGVTTFGSIFKMTPAGDVTPVVQLGSTSAATGTLAGLMPGSDGNFYGTTADGGTETEFGPRRGMLFKVTPDGDLTTLVSFTGNSGNQKGWWPNPTLVQDNAGTIYGTTRQGGTHGYGTVFKLTSDNAFTTLVEFQFSAAFPTAGLVQGANGSLYGVTPYGGTNDLGTAFSITTFGTLKTLANFAGGVGAIKGVYPTGGLTLGSDGNFYGTTSKGESWNNGTIFKMTPDGALTTLVQFVGATNGMDPRGSLVQGSDRNFYGTTLKGGTDRWGTIFQMTPAGGLTLLVSFSNRDGLAKGAYPFGKLVQSSVDGSFYGTTSYGGVHGYGTVFKVTPAGTLTTLVEFTGNGTTNKGSYPAAGLCLGSDGNFYGTTSYGGGNSCGTVFMMTPDGTLATLVEFTDNGTSNKGAHPQGGLVQGSDGNFYGTTPDGGAYECGTVFQMTPAGVLTTLVELTFDGPYSKGAYPLSELYLANDGNFYGTTNAGGGFIGTVFRLRFGPTPVTRPATSVANTSATLQGVVFSRGADTTVTFEYGLAPDLAGATVQNADFIPGTTRSKAVSLPLIGLAPATTYYFRVVGQNADNTHPQQGNILKFKTLP